MFPNRVFQLVLPIVAVIGFMFTGSVRAVDLYNNLAESAMFDDNFATNSSGALSFRTTANEYMIDTVKIPLRLFGQAPATSGNVTVSIYNTTGSNSRPGSSVGTAIGVMPVSSLSYSFQTITFAGLNRVLSPSTDYYIVISSSSSNLDGFVSAGLTSNFTGTLGSNGYWNGGNPNWGKVGNGSIYAIGSVSAIAPGPEPSTYALAAISTGVMATVASRRKARLG